MLSSCESLLKVLAGLPSRAGSSVFYNACRSVHASSSAQPALGMPSEAEAGPSGSEHAAPWGGALPATATYGLRVVVKGFELLHVKEASTVIRDLMLIHFAPKSGRMFEGVKAQPSWPSNLMMPVGDVATPTQRTLYSVMRSPHKYKTSMEQYMKVVHRRVVNCPTVNLSELDWFIDSVKLYQFTGVELHVKVTTPTYLLPTPPEDQQAAAQPLLAAHARRFSQYFPRASSSSSAAGAGAGGGGGGGGAAAAVSDGLEALQGLMEASLREQRHRLAGGSTSGRYQEWVQRAAAAQGSSGAASGSSAGAGREVERALEVAAAEGAVSGSGAGAAAGDVAVPGAPLLAALQQVMKGLEPDALARQQYLPTLMAQWTPGPGAPPAAEWMYAVLAAARRAQAGAPADAAGAAAAAAAQHAGLSQLLSYMLLRMWHERVDGGLRAELALPDNSRVRELLGEDAGGSRPRRQGGGDA